MRRLCLSVLLSATAWAQVEPAAAPGLVPVERFAEAPRISEARLSPDGEYVAFISEINRNVWPEFLELRTEKVLRINPGTTLFQNMSKAVGNLCWVGDNRVSFLAMLRDVNAVLGLEAVGRDGGGYRVYTGSEANGNAFRGDGRPLLAGEIIHCFDDSIQRVLVVDRYYWEGADYVYPAVAEISTRGSRYKTVQRNPGDVVQWLADPAGVVRAGVTRKGLERGTIYREGADAEWRRVPPSAPGLKEARPLGFDATGRKLLMAVTTGQNRRALGVLDVQDGRPGELLAADDRYDLIPQTGEYLRDNWPLTGLAVTKFKGAPEGIRYLAEKPMVRWFEPKLAALQRALDQGLPHTVNVIINRSRDEKRALVLAFSDRDPGRYYLWESAEEKAVLRSVGERQADFPVARMGFTQPIRYAARDGQEIPGYLTLPPGPETPGRPLVVLPHEYPAVRDVWGYDPLVQFLASRGYAVLQVNHRGSAGYGSEFSEKGRRGVGHGIQTDIEDGVKWAVAQGHADPARIAIAGRGLAAFSALLALGQSPELYRCGISLSGITDWARFVQEHRKDRDRFNFWREERGLPLADEDKFLASISPANNADKIRAPVLLVHGEDDEEVPAAQARHFARALAKVGHKPETLYLAGEPHEFRWPKSREKMFRALEAFLAKNLAPK